MKNNTQICRTMRALVAEGVAHDRDCLDTNDINLTVLAEATAHELGHDEWLDDETHEVWDCALTAVAEKP